MTKKQRFEQYMSAALTRMIKRDGKVSAFAIPYIDFLRILTDRIREFNAKFIRDKSSLRLASVLQFILKIVKYTPHEGRGWQPLPKFLAKKKAIINIQNNDDSCFGYALLYFLELVNLQKRNGNCFRATLYKEEMFQRHHLDTLPYPILPNDVHLYECQLQISINVFSFFDDEGRARHPLVIRRKNHERVANLLYWKDHYAPITSIPRLLTDIRKHSNQSIFVSGSSGTFHRKKSSRDTTSFLLETTSCQFIMYSRCQAQNRRKSNSTSSSIVQKRLSLSMRILSPSSSRLVAR